MQILEKKIEKAKEIFKLLGFNAERQKEQGEKLENLLMMDMAAEALAEKGIVPEGADFAVDEVENFLLDNYEESELEDLAKRVTRDVVVEFVSKLAKEVDEEKKAQIEEILQKNF